MTAEGSRTLYWSIAIAATIVVAFFSTVFSITHGIYDIFPFLYVLPIILFVYFYPDKGILFTVALSSVYLVLICTLSNLNSVLVAVSTAWFVIFVTIGVVTSSLAGGLRTEERKYRGLFENSQAGIFIFDLATVRVTDTNARYAHMLRYEVDDLIGKDLTRILLESAETGRSGDSEIHLYTRDGSVRQFLISVSLTPTNMVICSAIDITDQKLAEQVIQKAREDLEIRVRERTEDLRQSNEELRTEILERKKFDDAIQLANRKLNTLSNITRHDNLNQITASVMYLSLTEELSDNSALVANLKKIGKITQLIQKQIQFTRDYQNIGASSPQWQNVTAVVS